MGRIRLSKPLYEAVPYLYMALGLLLFGVAYHFAGRLVSDFALVFGVLSLLVGLVLLLRRRGYRAARAHYTGGPLDKQT